MRLTLLVLLLTLASGAQAAPDIPMGGQVGSPQPTTLEGLAADLRSETPARRGYAVRELKRRLKATRRTLERKRPGTIEHDEARVDRADQLRHVGPPAAGCVERYPGQRANCAVLLEILADPTWRGALERTLPEARGKAKKRIEDALAAIEAREAR